MPDWDLDRYGQFAGLRLQPALDLLSRVPSLPAGDIVDLGCGAGAVAEALERRFPERHRIGVDRSPKMLAQAQKAHPGYSALVEADLPLWEPSAKLALIYRNAALNWVADHSVLLPRLAGFLAPKGTLAFQVPRQSARPSHALWRTLSAELFPDRFDWSDWAPEVADPAFYAALLSGLGTVHIWETEYYQHLPSAGLAHPVRIFTRATYGRRVLGKLSAAEQAVLEAAYDARVADVYPLAEDGAVWFPFRRLFCLLTRDRIDARSQAH